MDNRKVFATNLKRQMALNDKSRRDVCDALGFSYFTFSDWVNGKTYPRIDKVEMLAEYFGILKTDLIEEKEKPTNSGGLTDSQKKLIEFAKTVPDDKADMILRVIRSIVEGD